MPSTLAICNLCAGNGRARAHWPRIRRALREAGVAFDEVTTRFRWEAIRLAAEAARAYAVVIAVGGDGTVHEVANGLLRASGGAETIALGIVPLGNGDDFAKLLPPETPVGGQPFGWPEAVRKIVEGRTELFDAGCVRGDGLRPELGRGPHYFVNGLSLGFAAEGAVHFASLRRWLGGRPGYLAAALRTLLTHRSARVRLQFDDEAPAFEQSTSITAIMNGRCLGNGFWVAPTADARDGLFDVLVVTRVGRLTILRLLPKLLKGTHAQEPVLRMSRHSRVRVEGGEPLQVECDGELPFVGVKSLQVEVLPRKLRVLV